MEDERRDGYVDLGQKLDEHIERFDMFEQLVVQEIAGEKHTDITGEVFYRGGIQGDLGQVKEAIGRLEHSANNGGVNAKIKLTFWQRFAIGAIGPVSAIITALIVTNQTGGG